MQEVLVIRYCDQHLKADGVKTPGLPRSTPIAIGSEEAEIDLCEECDGRMIEPLRELLRAIHSRTERGGPEQRDDDEDGDSRVSIASQCPLCHTWMDIRSRSSHARNLHPDLERGAIDWRYGDDVDEVWLCTCGSTFPTFRGRNMHSRSKSRPECQIPENDVTQPAKRPV